MTVRELVDKLYECDPEAEVIIELEGRDERVIYDVADCNKIVRLDFVD
jgi:hypothetical protein